MNLRPHKTLNLIMLLVVIFFLFGSGNSPATYAQEAWMATPTQPTAPIGTPAVTDVSPSILQLRDAQSTTGPIPPAGAVLPESLEYVAGASAHLINHVPAYIWHHGCGPTAAGMVIGYWDQYWDARGYEWLVSGNAATQTSAVDEVIASSMGVQSHYSDYSIPIDNFSTGLYPDKSELPLGDEHPHNSIADFMRTSWSNAGNYYGWSWYSDVSPALLGYTNMVNPGGFAVNSVNSNYYDGTFNWDMFRSEIDAGHPMVLLVDSDGDGGTDHFVPAFGYDDSTGIQKYAAYNTWDDLLHWYDFGPMTSGKSWGIYGGTSLSISSTSNEYLIFSDGFESGSLSKWSSNTPDSGDLSVTSAAKHTGSFGMHAAIDDNVLIYVTDDLPEAETHYQASFYFDPNSITMTSGDTHIIFGGYSNTSTLILRVRFGRDAGNYQLQAALLNDGSTWMSTTWHTISDAYHQIKLDWKAATAAGANNGNLAFWVDNHQLPELAGVDNDTRRIDRARLGAVNGVDTGTRGTYYFDEFVSSRGSESPQTFVLTVNKTGTGSGTVTSSPAGINCGPDCSESLGAGTALTLTATADPGSDFTGWSGGGCPASGPCTVTMTADTTVTANFTSSLTPDLIIESITSVPADPPLFQPVIFSVVIKNQGQSDAGRFNVDLFLNTSIPDSCSREGQLYFQVNGLAAGARLTVVFDYWEGFGRVGDLVINGMVDSKCTVSESMEDNNTKSINLTVDDLDNIFTDGFGSGDFSKWSSCTTGGGDLSVITGAPYGDIYRMQANIDDSAAIYCTSDHPTAEKRYLAKFSFDPNSITMTSGDTHLIFGGYNDASTLVMRVRLRRYAGSYQVQASLLNDGSTWKTTNWYAISDYNHDIQVYWKAATAAGANDGSLALWIDEFVKEELAGVDNDTHRIDLARLGAVNGIDAGTRGSYYFDGFCSLRGDAGTEPTATLTISKSGTGSGTVTSSPAGINCGSDCSEIFTSGTTVTLTAISAAGSDFIGWSGVGCSGTGTCTLTLSTDASVTARFDLTSSTDLIFANGFETGNLSAWTSSSTDTGDLSVTSAAALAGSRGMQAVIDDASAIFVTDDTPIAEPRYRVRFYFDPNSVVMSNGDAHILFRGVSGSSTVAVRVELGFSAGTYQIRAALVNDSTSWTQTSWFTISDSPHFIELDWRAATAAGANNGGLTFWIDGAQKQNVTGTDNDTRRIDRILLGAVTGIDAGTRGIYYFDAFESRRQNYIGP